MSTPKPKPTTYYYRYDIKNAPQRALQRFDPLSIALMQDESAESYLKYYGYRPFEVGNEQIAYYRSDGQAVDEFLILVQKSHDGQDYRLVVHVADNGSLTDWRRETDAPYLYRLFSMPGLLPPARSDPKLNVETFSISRQLAKVMAGG